MDACPECRAFLQPDWDRCKICGHVLGTPTTAEAAAAAGGGRRARRAARSASAPAAPPPRERVAATTAPGPGPLPPLFGDEPAPAAAPGPSSGSGSRTRWVIGAVVVVVVAVGAYLVLGGDDEPDPYADRPVGESPDGGSEAADALGEWSTFPVGPVSVELPAPPFVDETVEQILVIGELTMVRGEVLANGLTYTVAAGPLPEGVVDRDPDELLQRAVDRWATAEAGSVVSSEQITVDGAPALRAVISGLERDTHLVVVIDGGALVELRVAGQEPDPAAIQRLIDTLDA